MNTFVIKGFVMRRELSGFNREGVKFEKEIIAENLYQAYLIFLGEYPDANTYRVNLEDSYMKLL